QVQAFGAHTQIEIEQCDADELQRHVQQTKDQREQRLDDDLCADQAGGVVASPDRAQDQALKDGGDDQVGAADDDEVEQKDQRHKANHRPEAPPRQVPAAA